MKVLLAILLLAPLAALAHKASDSYVQLQVDGAQISGRWDIALRDLEYAIGLDGDGDGAITWGEVRGAQSRVAAYALSRLELQADGTGCALESNGVQITEHSDGHYAVLLLAGNCAAPPRDLRLRYNLLFDLDPLHRGLLNLDFGGSVRTAVFSPQTRENAFDITARSSGRVFVQYLREGLWHVWSGLDHLLFLAGLFLPAVLWRRHGQWVAAPSLRDAIWETARIVTAFTIAHAFTLTLAASGLIQLPTRLVESLVAATVMFAGLNNLVPMVRRGLFWLAWGFGLIHGAAIAGALAELGLPASGRVWALLAFNLGVEAAQLALVALVIPLSFALRHSRIYRYAVLIPSAIGVSLIGLAWLLQRSLQLDIPWLP